MAGCLNFATKLHLRRQRENVVMALIVVFIFIIATATATTSVIPANSSTDGVHPFCNITAYVTLAGNTTLSAPSQPVAVPGNPPLAPTVAACGSWSFVGQPALEQVLVYTADDLAGRSKLVPTRILPEPRTPNAAFGASLAVSADAAHGGGVFVVVGAPLLGRVFVAQLPGNGSGSPLLVRAALMGETLGLGAATTTAGLGMAVAASVDAGPMGLAAAGAPAAGGGWGGVVVFTLRPPHSLVARLGALAPLGGGGEGGAVGVGLHHFGRSLALCGDLLAIGAAGGRILLLRFPAGRGPPLLLPHLVPPTRAVSAHGLPLGFLCSKAEHDVRLAFTLVGSGAPVLVYHVNPWQAFRFATLLPVPSQRRAVAIATGANVVAVGHTAALADLSASGTVLGPDPVASTQTAATAPGASFGRFDLFDLTDTRDGAAAGPPWVSPQQAPVATAIAVGTLSTGLLVAQSTNTSASAGRLLPCTDLHGGNLSTLATTSTITTTAPSTTVSSANTTVLPSPDYAAVCPRASGVEVEELLPPANITVDPVNDGSMKFGEGLAADDGWLAVGASDSHLGYGGGTTYGRVLLYRLRSAAASASSLPVYPDPFQILVPPTSPVHAASFGSTLALHGPLLAVSAPDTTGGGAVFVYRHRDEPLAARAPWRLARTLRHPTLAEYNGFGFGLHILDTTRLAVGSPQNNRAPSTSGGVYIYDMAAVLAPNGGPGDPWPPRPDPIANATAENAAAQARPVFSTPLQELRVPSTLVDSSYGRTIAYDAARGVLAVGARTALGVDNQYKRGLVLTYFTGADGAFGAMGRWQPTAEDGLGYLSEFGTELAFTAEGVLLSAAPAASATSPICGVVFAAVPQPGAAPRPCGRLLLRETAIADEFGSALVAVGNTAVVGAARRDRPSPSGLNAGGVYIFNVTSLAASTAASIHYPRTAVEGLPLRAEALAGNTLAIDAQGGTLAIGLGIASTQTQNSGSVIVACLDSDDVGDADDSGNGGDDDNDLRGLPCGDALVTPPGLPPTAPALALEFCEGTALLAAFQDDLNLAVWRYTRRLGVHGSTAWAPEACIANISAWSGPVSMSCDVAGSALIGGQAWAGGRGGLWLRDSSSNSTQLLPLPALGMAAHLGASVAIAGDTAVAGAPGNRTAFAWTRSPDGGWAMALTFEVSASNDDTQVGQAVALSPDAQVLVVGGEHAAWVFRRASGDDRPPLHTNSLRWLETPIGSITRPTALVQLAPMLATDGRLLVLVGAGGGTATPVGAAVELERHVAGHVLAWGRPTMLAPLTGKESSLARVPRSAAVIQGAVALSLSSSTSSTGTVAVYTFPWASASVTDASPAPPPLPAQAVETVVLPAGVGPVALAPSEGEGPIFSPIGGGLEVACAEARELLGLALTRRCGAPPARALWSPEFAELASDMAVSEGYIFVLSSPTDGAQQLLVFSTVKSAADPSLVFTRGLGQKDTTGNAVGLAVRAGHVAIVFLRTKGGKRTVRFYLLQWSGAALVDLVHTVSVSLPVASSRRHTRLSFDADGRTLAVGLHGLEQDTGAVVILELASDDDGADGSEVWHITTTLKDVVPQATAQFGRELIFAPSGGLLLVSAWRSTTSGMLRAGKLVVLRRDNGGAGDWQQVTSYAPQDVGNGWYFGSSLAVDGPRVAVGAEGAIIDQDGIPGGAVFILRLAVYENGSIAFVEEARLSMPAAVGQSAVADRVGHSVAFAGDVVVALVPGWAGTVQQEDDEGLVLVWRLRPSLPPQLIGELRQPRRASTAATLPEDGLRQRAHSVLDRHVLAYASTNREHITVLSAITTNIGKGSGVAAFTLDVSSNVAGSSRSCMAYHRGTCSIDGELELVPPAGLSPKQQRGKGGTALAMNSKLLAIGLPSLNTTAPDGGSCCGAVDVYATHAALDAEDQTQRIRIVANPLAAGSTENFGNAVAMIDGLLAVGASGAPRLPMDDRPGAVGSVFVYDADMNSAGKPMVDSGAQLLPPLDWQLPANVAADDTDTVLQYEAGLGWAIAVGSGRIVGGAPLKHVPGPGKERVSRSGAVLMWEYIAGRWQLVDAAVKPQVARQNAYFGAVLAIQGELLAVGAPHAAGGRVHLYHQRGGVWATLAEVEDTSMSQLGMALAWGPQGLLVIGAPGYGDQSGGAILVLRVVADSSVLHTKILRLARLVDPAATVSGQLGAALAVNGRLVLSAAYLGDSVQQRLPDVPASVGHAVLYRLPLALVASNTSVAQGGEPQLGPIARFSTAFDDAGQEFGRSVALSPDYILVGAPGRRKGQGAVFAYCAQVLAAAADVALEQVDGMFTSSPVTTIASIDSPAAEGSQSALTPAVTGLLVTFLVLGAVAAVTVAVVVQRRHSAQTRKLLTAMTELAPILPAHCRQQAEDEFEMRYADLLGDRDTCRRLFEARGIGPGELQPTGKVLGEGMFAQVLLARFAASPEHPGWAVLGPQPVGEKALVAVKELRMGQGRELAVVSQVLLEARLLAVMDHPHVVRLVAVSDRHLPLRLALEYCAEGDLRHFLRAGGESRLLPGPAAGCLVLAHQVATAVQYLHSKLCIHRDLAARNVLLQATSVESRGENSCGFVAKLADLGLARALRTEEDYYKSRGEDAVPIRWQCPTAVQTRVYTAKSDVYSFGVLLWELFSSGATPFGDMSAGDAFRAVCAGHRLPRPRASTAEDVVQLIRMTTASEVQLRPAMTAVCRTLQMLATASDAATGSNTRPTIAPGARVQGAHVVNRVFTLGRTAWSETEDDAEETQL